MPTQSPTAETTLMSRNLSPPRAVLNRIVLAPGLYYSASIPAASEQVHERQLGTITHPASIGGRHSEAHPLSIALSGGSIRCPQ